LWGRDSAKNAGSGENSLLISCTTGNLSGDGFAEDWARHQPSLLRSYGRQASSAVKAARRSPKGEYGLALGSQPYRHSGKWLNRDNSLHDGGFD
jgi:hypothetical protein